MSAIERVFARIAAADEKMIAKLEELRAYRDIYAAIIKGGKKA